MTSKHIIWDFNGTLLGDAQLSVDCDNYVFDVLGLPHITIEDYRAHMTMPVRNFYTALGVDLSVYPYETISRLWLDRFNRLAVEAGLVPGVMDVVQALHERGISQSVLSASYEPSLREQCQHLGLTPYMQRIDGLSDESAMPKTEIGKRQLKALGISGGEALLVGDMMADSELAHALGASCVLVPWGHNNRARLETTHRPICDTCDALLAHILEASR